LVDFFLLPRT